jgi:hypothetical protein
VGLPCLAGVATLAPIGCLSLLAVLVYVPDEHPAAKAGAGTLEAGIVSLYGVVIVVGVYPSASAGQVVGDELQ